MDIISNQENYFNDPADQDFLTNWLNGPTGQNFLKGYLDGPTGQRFLKIMTAVDQHQLPTPAILREGGVIWITGLAESGKTTVSRALIQQIQQFGIKPVHLDGNVLREAIGETRSFDRESRRKLGYMYARFSRMLATQRQLVVCSTISLFHDLHEWNRKNIDRYFEVFLDVPLEELKKRDSKGIYHKLDDAETVGIGIKPEFPVNPDLQIANLNDIHPQGAAAHILSACLTRPSH